jgi:hypothetical protein
MERVKVFARHARIHLIVTLWITRRQLQRAGAERGGKFEIKANPYSFILSLRARFLRRSNDILSLSLSFRF